MSVGAITDIQQLRMEIEELKRAVDDLEPSLKVAPERLATFRQLERVALRYLLLARRIGLPDDVNRATQFLTRILVMLRMAQMSIAMMATGPIGILLGVAGIGLTVMSLADMSEGY
jgi:hypothetical protein